MNSNHGRLLARLKTGSSSGLIRQLAHQNTNSCRELTPARRTYYNNGNYAYVKSICLPVANVDFGTCGPRSRVVVRKNVVKVEPSGRRSRIPRVIVHEKLFPMIDIRTTYDIMKARYNYM
jgi:hypothetical protein